MKRTMNDVHGSNCAVAATAEIITTKWTPLIIHDLSEGPRRFMELEHACPGSVREHFPSVSTCSNGKAS